MYTPSRDTHTSPTRRSSDLRIARQCIDGLEPGKLLVDMDVIGRHDRRWIVERADVNVDLVCVALGCICHRRSARSEGTRLNSSHRCISYAVFCLNKNIKCKT